MPCDAACCLRLKRLLPAACAAACVASPPFLPSFCVVSCHLSGCFRTPASPTQLVARWQQDGQVIDGNLLWTAEAAQLCDMGCSASVAHRIVRAVAAVKEAAAATQVGA